MAKTGNKTRRYPLVLAILGALFGFGFAAHYRNQAIELENEYANPDAHTFDVNPGMVQAMKNGATLQITIDKSGKTHYNLND